MNKFPLILIMQSIILLYGLIAQCWGNNLMEINVRPLSFVNHKIIKLGDIAQITGDETYAVKAAKSIAIVPSPFLHRSIFIRKGIIRKALLQDGFDLKKIKLSFPREIIVKNKLIRISEEEVKETIREYIYKNVPWPEDQVEITQINFKGDILLPDGEITKKVIAKENENFIGKVPLYLEFIVDGKVVKRSKARVKIEVLMPVVLTRVSLKRNQIIDENDVYVENRLFSKFIKKIYTSRDEVVGKKAKRRIKAKQPLYESLLEIPADISKGDSVTILIETKNIRITTPGIAGQNGQKGQVIKIKNLNSNKMVYAKVINNTTVKVEVNY